MTKRFILGALQFKNWTLVGQLLLLLLVGTIYIGSSGESGPPERETASTLLDEQPLLQHSFTTVPPQIRHDTNVKEDNVPTRGRPASAAPEDSDLPPQILTAAHLPSLKQLVSHEKITVRLGLRLSLTGPRELLDPQLLLSLYKEPGIYSLGGNAGLFSMRLVGIKKVTSAP